MFDVQCEEDVSLRVSNEPRFPTGYSASTVKEGEDGDFATQQMTQMIYKYSKQLPVKEATASAKSNKAQSPLKSTASGYAATKPLSKTGPKTLVTRITFPQSKAKGKPARVSEDQSPGGGASPGLHKNKGMTKSQTNMFTMPGNGVSPG